MATFLSDVKTAAAQVSISDQVINNIRFGARVLFSFPVYTLAGTEAAADIIKLFDLPPGGEIVPELSLVTCSADPGTTLTLNVGDIADVDRYAAGIVLSAGGQVAFTNTAIPAAVGTKYGPTAETEIYATVASAAGLTASVKLCFTIAYRILG